MIREACEDYSYVMYLDLLPHFTDGDQRQDHYYYEDNGFYLNKDSSSWLRQLLIDEISDWKAKGSN